MTTRRRQRNEFKKSTGASRWIFVGSARLAVSVDDDNADGYLAARVIGPGKSYGQGALAWYDRSEYIRVQSEPTDSFAASANVATVKMAEEE